MSSDKKNLDSTRIVVDPPPFSPPREMRAGYLERRKAELEQMLEQAETGEWKPVMVIINHVRGTGAMYGFDNLGCSAENVVRAVQNGEAASLDLLREYARAVSESYV